jgi:hypothetical protein
MANVLSPSMMNPSDPNFNPQLAEMQTPEWQPQQMQQGNPLGGIPQMNLNTPSYNPLLLSADSTPTAVGGTPAPTGQDPQMMAKQYALQSLMGT